MKAVKFRNYTDHDFSWKYDGIEYTFRAGETMFLEDYKAAHFAKHLIDRELGKLGISTGTLSERTKLEQQCLPGDEPITQHEAIQIEEEKKEAIIKEEKKRGRPKKIVEEEFADLNN